jgi:hypothetical protein
VCKIFKFLESLAEAETSNFDIVPSEFLFLRIFLTKSCVVNTCLRQSCKCNMCKCLVNKLYKICYNTVCFVPLFYMYSEYLQSLVI